MPHTSAKSSYAATKTWCSQISKYWGEKTFQLIGNLERLYTSEVRAKHTHESVSSAEMVTEATHCWKREQRKRKRRRLRTEHKGTGQSGQESVKENEREKSRGGTERPQCRRSCRGQFQNNFEYFLFFKKTGASLMTQWLKKKKKKKSTCQCRRHQFHPWSRKIPHAMGQLSPGSMTTEALAPQSLCSTTGEAAAVRSPRSPQQRNAQAVTKTRHSHK